MKRIHWMAIAAIIALIIAVEGVMAQTVRSTEIERFLAALPVIESIRQPDGTGYALHANGRDTLVVVYGKTTGYNLWRAMLGDSAFVRIATPPVTVRMTRAEWNTFRQVYPALAGLESYLAIEEKVRSGK